MKLRSWPCNGRTKTPLWRRVPAVLRPAGPHRQPHGQRPAGHRRHLQDVFLKIWHNRKSLAFTYSIKSYLYRAAINAALNYLEKSKRTVGMEDSEFAEPAAEGAEDALHLREVESRVQAAIDTLPPACKTIFVLSRYEEMSYKEIAESMQISVKTVENQMGKALRQLKQYLSAYAKHLFSFFL
jgi:RNA polymerase sigma-70 factor (ECF subfamily)